MVEGRCRWNWSCVDRPLWGGEQVSVNECNRGTEGISSVPLWERKLPEVINQRWGRISRLFAVQQVCLYWRKWHSKTVTNASAVINSHTESTHLPQRSENWHRKPEQAKSFLIRQQSFVCLGSFYELYTSLCGAFTHKNLKSVQSRSSQRAMAFCSIKL